jgi:hypothetical protein
MIALRTVLSGEYGPNNLAVPRMGKDCSKSALRGKRSCDSWDESHLKAPLATVQLSKCDHPRAGVHSVNPAGAFCNRHLFRS